MSKKLQKISVLMVIIGFLVVGMRANTLLANYPIVPDLTIESTQEEGTINEPFQLKIVDANTLDTKVWFPLPANVSFTGSQNEHGSVTYDAENHQLVIDWNNQEEENRFVTIELLASEAGSYEFQASVMREEETVASQPVVNNVEEDTENLQEEEVEVPVENEQPEVVKEDQQEEINVENQQEIENEKQAISENEQVKEIIGTVDDPRIGLPIKDIFPDPNMAKAVAESATIFMLRPITIETPLTQEIIDKQTMGIFVSKNISDVSGIDIFSGVMYNYYLSNNNIKELPSNFISALGKKNSLSINLIDLSNNKLSNLPRFIANSNDSLSIREFDLSNNQLIGLNDDFELFTINSLNLSNNLLTNVPPSLFKTRYTFWNSDPNYFGLNVDGNLLPSNGDQFFNELMEKNPYLYSGNQDIKTKWKYGSQQQLNFNSELPINTICTSNEIENETLLETFRPYIEKGDEPIPNSLPLNVLDFVNKDGEVVDISTYFKDGKVIKNEDIYVKIQSRTDGVYDNDQNGNSITSNQAQLVLKTFGKLSFVQAPSHLSFGEDLKITAIDQVFPLQSFDRPLSIQDDKAEKSTWRMTAKMTKELTSPSNRVLENSLHYRLNGEDNVLNKTELNIYNQQNSNDEPFNISDTWVRDEQNGLFLEIKAGQALAEEYSGTIEWKLQDVPNNIDD